MGYRVTRRRPGRWRHGARAAATTLCVLGLSSATVLPVTALQATSASHSTLPGSATDSAASGAVGLDDDDDPRLGLSNAECTFPSESSSGTPWSLQRLLFEQMWKDTRGKNVSIAVIDSGVDNENKQLKPAVAKGEDVIAKKGDGTKDEAGHGTKVAGIIAARSASDTGFVGIAPDTTIIPIRQNDNKNTGKVATLVRAIDYAISRDVDIINISQGTTNSLPPGSVLHKAVERAQADDILVVASAGNDGAAGKAKDNYPAAIKGVLGVGASDRNNERAAFSQSGDHVDIAAPGVDMVSTVPGGGHCIDHGTSFAAPYATGVAALVRAKHPKWTYEQVIWHLQGTADRVRPTRDDNVGWGVVDPVMAMGYDGEAPKAEPKPGTDQAADVDADNIIAAPLILGETPQERRVRYALYIFTGGMLGVAVVVGSAVAIRDWRRKTSLDQRGGTA